MSPTSQTELELNVASVNKELNHVSVIATIVVLLSLIRTD